jgi:hypothetical protein
LNFDKFKKTVQIPVRVVKGRLQFFYGGDLPELKDDTVGDLIVPENAIIDKAKLQQISNEMIKELLPIDTNLMIQISAESVKKIGDTLRKYLCHNLKTMPPLVNPFVEIYLKQPLRIKLRGTKKGDLEPCLCAIPSLNDLEATSINHAYTLVSEKFEMHRKSHTANVFDKVYFFDSNGFWKPLEVLRERVEGAYEEELFVLSPSD